MTTIGKILERNRTVVNNYSKLQLEDFDATTPSAVDFKKYQNLFVSELTSAIKRCYDTFDDAVRMQLSPENLIKLKIKETEMKSIEISFVFPKNEINIIEHEVTLNIVGVDKLNPSYNLKEESFVTKSEIKKAIENYQDKTLGNMKEMVDNIILFSRDIVYLYVEYLKNLKTNGSATNYKDEMLNNFLDMLSEDLTREIYINQLFDDNVNINVNKANKSINLSIYSPDRGKFLLADYIFSIEKAKFVQTNFKSNIKNAGLLNLKDLFMDNSSNFIGILKKDLQIIFAEDLKNEKQGKGNKDKAVVLAPVSVEEPKEEIVDEPIVDTAPIDAEIKDIEPNLDADKAPADEIVDEESDEEKEDEEDEEKMESKVNSVLNKLNEKIEQGANKMVRRTTKMERLTKNDNFGKAEYLGSSDYEDFDDETMPEDDFINGVQNDVEEYDDFEDDWDDNEFAIVNDEDSDEVMENIKRYGEKKALTMAFNKFWKEAKFKSNNIKKDLKLESRDIVVEMNDKRMIYNKKGEVILTKKIQEAVSPESNRKMFRDLGFGATREGNKKIRNFGNSAEMRKESKKVGFNRMGGTLNESMKPFRSVLRQGK